MFCHKCGSKVEENAGFCHKCGTGLVAESQEQAQDVSTAEILQTNDAVSLPTQPERKSSGSMLKIGIGALAVIIAIVVIIAIIPSGGTDYVDTVQTHTPFIDDGDTTTIEDVVNRFFSTPIWRERTESNNLTLVDVRGIVMDVDGRRLNVILTYRVTPNPRDAGWYFVDLESLEISGALYGVDAAESFEIDLFDAYEGRYDSLAEFFLSLGYSQGIAQTFMFYFAEDNVGGGWENDSNVFHATFGSTFDLLGFEITIADTWNFEDFGGDGMFFIPMRITNVSNTTLALDAGVRVWSPNGIGIFGGLADSPQMFAGASLDTDIRFQYSGDGEYIVELFDIFDIGGVDVVLTLPVSRHGATIQGADTTNWQDVGEVLIPPDWHVDDSMDSLVVFGMVGGQEIELVANWIEEDFSWLVDSANTSSQFTFADGTVGYRLDFSEEIMWISPTAHRALTFRHRGQIGLYNAGSDVINSIAVTLRNPWMD